jgi:hypothetical protein
MKILIVEFIGFVLIVYSLKTLLKIRSINPIAVFNFEDASHEFKIQKPGYYSISILGAGFVREVERVIIKLTLDNSNSLEVDVNKIAPRFTKDKRIGIEYWGFSADSIGRYIITLSNLQHVEAKSSMLRSKRLFESPIDHSKLRIFIHQSIPPLHKLISIVSLIFGTGLIVFGLLAAF